jgi:hypothetical protein
MATENKYEALEKSYHKAMKKYEELEFLCGKLNENIVIYKSTINSLRKEKDKYLVGHKKYEKFVNKFTEIFEENERVKEKSFSRKGNKKIYEYMNYVYYGKEGNGY